MYETFCSLLSGLINLRTKLFCRQLSSNFFFTYSLISPEANFAGDSTFFGYSFLITSFFTSFASSFTSFLTSWLSGFDWFVSFFTSLTYSFALYWTFAGFFCSWGGEFWTGFGTVTFLGSTCFVAYLGAYFWWGIDSSAFYFLFDPWFYFF